MGDGQGHFRDQILHGSTNKDYGSSGLCIADVNQDGRPDIVDTNGDGIQLPVNAAFQTVARGALAGEQRRRQVRLSPGGGLSGGLSARSSPTSRGTGFRISLPAAASTTGTTGAPFA